MGRVWIDDSGIPLNATNLNGMETDIAAARAAASVANSKNAEQDGRLTTVESVTSAQDKRISSVEVLGGLAPGDASDATVSNLVTNPASNTTTALKAKLVSKGELVKNVNDYANLSAARAASSTIASPGHYAPAALSTDNSYTSTDYTDAQGFMLQAGTRAAPTADPSPVLWVEKVDNSSRDVVTSRWDSGAGHFNVVKVGGTAPSVALTGFARNENTEASGIGGSTGIHGRAETYQTAPGIWGAWFYAASRNTTAPASQMIGVEINLNSKAPDQGWMSSSGTGGSRGLVVVTQDNSNPVTIGIDIGRGTAAPSGHIHTGLLFRADSIVPAGANTSTGVNNNEAIRIEGDSSIGASSIGIRFRGGTKTIGISFAEMGFANNAAMLLADDQRIIVGPGPASSTYFSMNKANSWANLNNLSLAMNGTKVVGAQVTGWSTATGTATRTSFATSTVTLSQLAERVKALIDDLHGSLPGHGLIGS